MEFYIPELGKYFKDWLSKIDTREVFLHSLRSDGASTAAHQGISDRLISKQGKWSSKKARKGYNRDNAAA